MAQPGCGWRTSTLLTVTWSLSRRAKGSPSVAGRPRLWAIFVGGESRHIPMCQQIAQRLALPSTLGDPLARLLKDQVTVSGLDVRQPQPGWAIAVGLAIGGAQVNVEREAKSA